ISSEAISTLRLSRWVRRRASFAVVVVLPEPWRPTIMIGTGGTALRSMVWPSEPRVATSSSWTILTTIWPGVTDLTTVAPTACSRTLSVKLRTTSSETSASNSARRTSRIAASTSASASEPRPVSRSRMPPSRSDRLSNNAVVLRPASCRRCLAHRRHTPPPGWRGAPPEGRLQRGIQYAAASRFDPKLLWDTGSPAFAGDDELCVLAPNAKASLQTHSRPRAHSAVGRWPPVSRTGRRVEKKRLSDERVGLKPREPQKSRKLARNRRFLD